MDALMCFVKIPKLGYIKVAQNGLLLQLGTEYNKTNCSKHMGKIIYIACFLGFVNAANAQIVQPQLEMVRPIKSEVGDFKRYTIAPNPAYEYVDVDLIAADALPVELVIYNGRGEPVLKKSIVHADGTYRWDLDALDSGQYFLTIQIEGQGVIGRKLIINRF
jgi:Secretion system C-terminal sorting domain